MSEVRNIRGRVKKERYEFHGEGHWIEDVQWKRVTQAVVANLESRLEITENILKIPMATKSKSKRVESRNQKLYSLNKVTDTTETNLEYRES